MMTARLACKIGQNALITAQAEGNAQVIAWCRALLDRLESLSPDDELLTVADITRAITPQMQAGEDPLSEALPGAKEVARALQLAGCPAAANHLRLAIQALSGARQAYVEHRFPDGQKFAITLRLKNKSHWRVRFLASTYLGMPVPVGVDRLTLQ